VGGLETILLRVQRRHLVASRGGEVEGVEEQQQVTLSEQRFGREAATEVVLQREGGGLGADVDHGTSGMLVGLHRICTLLSRAREPDGGKL
jgi:hypothetical protein